MMLILGLCRTHPSLGRPSMGSLSTMHQTFENKRPPSSRRFKASGRAGARGPGFYLELLEVEEIGSNRPEKKCVVSDNERNGHGSCSFGSNNEVNVSKTAEIGFVYDQECVSDSSDQGCMSKTDENGRSHCSGHEESVSKS